MTILKRFKNVNALICKFVQHVEVDIKGKPIAPETVSLRYNCEIIFHDTPKQHEVVDLVIFKDVTHGDVTDTRLLLEFQEMTGKKSCTLREHRDTDITPHPYRVLDCK